MIYSLVIFPVILAFVVQVSRNKIIVNNGFKRSRRVTAEECFLFISLVAAIVVATLRGDFTADYSSYLSIFHDISNISWKTFFDRFTFSPSFEEVEWGFALFNFLIGRLAKNDFVFWMACAIITYYPMYRLSKYSTIASLSVLLFLSLGPFYDSFNTVRMIMAASIYVYSIKYVEERKFIRYALIVVVASLIHGSILLMLPAYFGFRLKANLKTIFLIVTVFLIGVASMEFLAIRYDAIFMVSFDENNLLEMLHRSSSSGAMIIIPILIALLGVILYFVNGMPKTEYVNLSKNKRIKKLLNQRVDCLFIGTVVWIMLQVGTIYTAYIGRFAYFFIGYVMLFIPREISNMRNKSAQRVLLLGVVLVCIVWFMIVGIIKYPYIFEWQ